MTINRALLCLVMVFRCFTAILDSLMGIKNYQSDRTLFCGKQHLGKDSKVSQKGKIDHAGNLFLF